MASSTVFSAGLYLKRVILYDFLKDTSFLVENMENHDAKKKLKRFFFKTSPELTTICLWQVL